MKTNPYSSEQDLYFNPYEKPNSNWVPKVIVIIATLGVTLSIIMLQSTLDEDWSERWAWVQRIADSIGAKNAILGIVTFTIVDIVGAMWWCISSPSEDELPSSFSNTKSTSKPALDAKKLAERSVGFDATVTSKKDTKPVTKVSADVEEEPSFFKNPAIELYLKGLDIFMGGEIIAMIKGNLSVGTIKIIDDFAESTKKAAILAEKERTDENNDEDKKHIYYFFLKITSATTELITAIKENKREKIKEAGEKLKIAGEAFEKATKDGITSYQKLVELEHVAALEPLQISLQRYESQAKTWQRESNLQVQNRSYPNSYSMYTPYTSSSSQALGHTLYTTIRQVQESHDNYQRTVQASNASLEATRNVTAVNARICELQIQAAQQKTKTIKWIGAQERRAISIQSSLSRLFAIIQNIEKLDLQRQQLNLQLKNQYQTQLLAAINNDEAFTRLVGSLFSHENGFEIFYKIVKENPSKKLRNLAMLNLLKYGHTSAGYTNGLEEFASIVALATEKIDFRRWFSSAVYYQHFEIAEFILTTCSQDSDSDLDFAYMTTSTFIRNDQLAAVPKSKGALEKCTKMQDSISKKIEDRKLLILSNLRQFTPLLNDMNNIIYDYYSPFKLEVIKEDRVILNEMFYFLSIKNWDGFPQNYGCSFAELFARKTQSYQEFIITYGNFFSINVALTTLQEAYVSSQGRWHAADTNYYSLLLEGTKTTILHNQGKFENTDSTKEITEEQLDKLLQGMFSCNAQGTKISSYSPALLQSMIDQS